jgi:hypothetical protein
MLGLFIVWQIIFLCAANVLEAARETRGSLPGFAARAAETVAPGWTAGEGPASEAVDTAAGVTRRWAQLTGQPQDWSLFAPDVPPDTVFPEVELRWDDGPHGLPPSPDTLLSDNEPADPTRYVRVGRFRLRRYEAALTLILKTYPDETEEEAKERWQGRIEAFVRRDWDAIRAYLRWRAEAYRERNPNAAPPSELILHMRRYVPPGPDEPGPFEWDGPFVMPVARWRPGEELSDSLPVEMYDPVTGTFRWLRYPGG